MAAYQHIACLSSVKHTTRCLPSCSCLTLTSHSYCSRQNSDMSWRFGPLNLPENDSSASDAWQTNSNFRVPADRHARLGRFARPLFNGKNAS